MPLYKSILLVDDDYVNNFITERLLRKSGISKEVKAVRNGEEALTFLSEQKNYCPDLILLDINMPEMDGINFVRNFKKMILDKEVKVVLLTGSIHPKDKELLQNMGFQDIMIKPFSEEKLMKILKKDLVNK